MHNLDLLVSEVDEFVHHIDLNLHQCLSKMLECIPKAERKIHPGTFFVDHHCCSLIKIIVIYSQAYIC